MGYWGHHGFAFLVLIVFFPRLTIAFATPFPQGIDQILAWIFFPRIYAAVLATMFYWGSNPFLVVIAWASAVTALLSGSRSASTFIANMNK